MCAAGRTLVLTTWLVSYHSLLYSAATLTGATPFRRSLSSAHRLLALRGVGCPLSQRQPDMIVRRNLVIEHSGDATVGILGDSPPAESCVVLLVSGNDKARPEGPPFVPVQDREGSRNDGVANCVRSAEASQEAASGVGVATCGRGPIQLLILERA